MKKEQMQEIIDEQSAKILKLNNDIVNLNNVIVNLNSTRENDMNNAKHEVEDKFYEQWKLMNGAFMKRFIAEMISTGDINFSFNHDWGGNFTMNINMGDECLASVDGEICMERNGLEE